MIPRNLQITIALLIVGILAAGGFILHLKSEAEKIQQPSSGIESGRPTAAPLNSPKEPVRLAIAYDEDGVLRIRETTASLPSDTGSRAQELLRVLFTEYVQRPSPHALGEGANVRAVYFVTGGMLVVDLNANFADHHPSGAMVEQLSVVSMAETLMLNMPSVKKVKFLVDGHERETLAGHVDLTTTYDTDQVAQMMKELQ